MVMTTCSSGIMSSMLSSALLNSMRERRSSPKRSLIFEQSSLMMPIRKRLSARMACKRPMISINSSYSARNLSRSSPVNFCRAHVQNGAGLKLAELELLHQAIPGLFGV